MYRAPEDCHRVHHNMANIIPMASRFPEITFSPTLPVLYPSISWSCVVEHSPRLKRTRRRQPLRLQICGAGSTCMPSTRKPDYKNTLFLTTLS